MLCVSICPRNEQELLDDFAKAKKEWDALTKEEQMDAYTEWHAFVETNYEKICATFEG